MFKFQNIIDNLQSLAMQCLPKVVFVIVSIIIGFWLVNKIANLAVKMMMNQELDESLAQFLKSILSIGLKIIILLSAASIVGIETTSFIAILGAHMIGIGLALIDSICHLASGVMIMIFKPFKVGELVTIG